MDRLYAKAPDLYYHICLWLLPRDLIRLGLTSKPQYELIHRVRHRNVWSLWWREHISTRVLVLYVGSSSKIDLVSIVDRKGRDKINVFAAKCGYEKLLRVTERWEIEEAFRIALQYGHLDLALELCSDGRYPQLDKEFVQSLIARGHIECLRFVLEKIYQGDINDFVITSCIRRKQVEIVKFMLSLGHRKAPRYIRTAVDIDCLELVQLLYTSDIVLVRVIHRCNSDIIAFVLNHDDIQYSPGLLSYVIKHNSVEMIEMMFTRFDISQSDIHRALWHAIIPGFYECTQFLLDKMDDTPQKENVFDPIVACAILYSHVKILKLLLQRGYTVNPQVYSAEMTRSSRRMKEFLQCLSRPYIPRLSRGKSE